MTDLKTNVENRIIEISDILDKLHPKTNIELEQSISLQQSLQEMINVYGFDNYCDFVNKHEKDPIKINKPTSDTYPMPDDNEGCSTAVCCGEDEKCAAPIYVPTPESLQYSDEQHNIVVGLIIKSINYNDNLINPLEALYINHLLESLRR